MQKTNPPTDRLQSEIKTAEAMKKHLNEYYRMVRMQQEVDELTEQSEALTEKIELARKLPWSCAVEANIPNSRVKCKGWYPARERLCHLVILATAKNLTFAWMWLLQTQRDFKSSSSTAQSGWMMRAERPYTRNAGQKGYNLSRRAQQTMMR